MTITKPFYRIIRFKKEDLSTLYTEHKKYTNYNKYGLIKAYKIIEEDLKKIFEYIEPCDKNLKTYSHQLFSLLLRSATEFETNCKIILKSNGYTKKRLDIRDYSKINNANLISKYQLKLKFWHPKEKILKPLKEWDKSHTLKWYKAYNKVKHDRSINFREANLENVINSIGGLFCILYSQFGKQTFNAYNQQYSFNIDEGGKFFHENSIFSIKPYMSWPSTKKYSFDWYKLKNDSDPFESYSF